MARERGQDAQRTGPHLRGLDCSCDPAPASTRSVERSLERAPASRVAAERSVLAYVHSSHATGAARHGPDRSSLAEITLRSRQDGATLEGATPYAWENFGARSSTTRCASTRTTTFTSACGSSTSGTNILHARWLLREITYVIHPDVAIDLHRRRIPVEHGAPALQGRRPGVGSAARAYAATSRPTDRRARSAGSLYLDARRRPATDSIYYFHWQAAWEAERPGRASTCTQLRRSPPRFVFIWPVPLGTVSSGGRRTGGRASTASSRRGTRGCAPGNSTACSGSCARAGRPRTERRDSARAHDAESGAESPRTMRQAR